MWFSLWGARQKASKLVEGEDCVLNALEVYLLLSAIQLHDVGNIYGRSGHENNIREIMLKADEACGRDDIERHLIGDIAEAHGGKAMGVRDIQDKIGQTLAPKATLLEDEVRPQIIASILRLADELADDKSRASRTLLNEGKIPKKSEIFHAYSSCLESVSIKPNENLVELTFNVPNAFTLRKFGKLDEELYLVDEIYNRTVKMHMERIYCMRFCKKILNIEQIMVSINFYSEQLDVRKHDPISYTLSESGYPVENEDGIYGLCDSLEDVDGNRIDGEYVKNKIADKTEGIEIAEKTEGIKVVEEAGKPGITERLKSIFWNQK